MLSAQPLTSAIDAAKYYQGVLDYYAGNENSINLEWQGKALDSLYPNTKPTMEDFKQLLKGELPTGQILGRMEDGEAKHRPGIDLTFSAPKSVSIMALLYDDKDVINAHSSAVTQTLKFFENSLLQTRINGEPAPADKVMFTKFLEFLSRELDPQMHTHCILLNLCQNNDGKFRSIFSDSVLENKMLGGGIYRSFLAIELQKLGYEIEITDEKATFEIKGVPKQLIDLFSKRSQQINAKAFELGRHDPEFKSTLNLTTRKSKTVETTFTQQQEQWKLEASELCQHLKIELDKSFAQFKTNTGTGYRIRDGDKIADEAIQAGIAKLDLFKRMSTEQEIILEATRLTLGKVLPKHIEAAFEKAKQTGMIQSLRFNENGHTQRKAYYMSASNSALSHELKTQIQNPYTNRLHTNLLSLVATKWVIHKSFSNVKDNEVYKQLIDFVVTKNNREMIADNLCPKVDKHFLQRAESFASLLGVKVFHVSVSDVDRKICQQAGLKTWGLNYLNRAFIKRGSILLVHGSEKLLYAQMHTISNIAKKHDCKIIWANDKDIQPLDRRLSPIELIAPYVPRGHFLAGTNHRLSYDIVNGTYPLRFENLGQDNFLQNFSKQFSSNNDALLLSYQKDSVNRLVRNQLVSEGTLEAGVRVTNYVHEYLNIIDIKRPTSYQLGDIIRLNNLQLLTSNENLIHNLKNAQYRSGEHFKLTTINGAVLTLSHDKNQTMHQLNLQDITNHKDLSLFKESSIKIAVGDKLILPNFDIYGKAYQNKIGTIESMDDNAIHLKLPHYNQSLVVYLKDSKGYERPVYADYAYCLHPSTNVQGINHYHMDCRANLSINVLRTLTGMQDKNVTLYTDSPQAIVHALESIRPDLSATSDKTNNLTKDLSYVIAMKKNEPTSELKINAAKAALNQAMHQLTGEGKTKLSKSNILREALSLTLGRAQIQDIQQTFEALVLAGDIVTEGNYYTASWVIQHRDNLIQAFKGLRDKNIEPSKENAAQQKGGIPRLDESAVNNYLQQRNIKLSNAPIKAIVDLASHNNALAILQGPAGSAKTSLVLKHVAALFQANQCKVIGIAPQHSQKDELARKAGIETMTIQKFLQLEKSHQLQEVIEKGKTVVLVDESSMLSYKEMLDLTYIADRYNARMIFAGDSQQLDSPRSAQPFLHLQQQEGMKIAELKKIYRQCAIKRPELHKAIVSLTRLKQGEKAESLVPYLRHNSKDKNLIDILCDTYEKLPKFLKDDCLILALTNAERQTINERLHTQTGPSFKQVMLRNQDLNNENRYRAACYTEGNVLKFNKEIKAAGIAANTYWQIVGIDAQNNKLTLANCQLDKSGGLKREHIITIDPMRKVFHQANTLEYFEAKTQSLSLGDKIMLTNNIRHYSSIKLNTSKQGILKKITQSHFTIDFGNNEVVKLERNKLDHAFIDLGYARTYHNAQSLDAACVLMLADLDNKHMMNYSSNYVGATRSKKFLRIFTQNKEGYLKQTQKSSQRMPFQNKQSIEQAKLSINEVKLLDDLSIKIERHAKKLFGTPKKTLDTALLYGSEDINIGVLIMTQNQQDFKRGDCLYANTKLDFVSLIELFNKSKREEALKFAAENLLRQPIEDYQSCSANKIAAQNKSIIIPKNAKPHPFLQAKTDAITLRAQGIEKAQRLYQQSKPAKNTLAETYLVKHRHITKEIIHQYSNDIRFIYYNRHSAALFPLRDKDGKVQAVHLVYLDAKTAQKTKATIGRNANTFALAKQTFGPMKGASIQVGDPTGIPHLAEGPETGLSILALNPKAHVHITCSLSNIHNAPIKNIPDKIIFCADNDMISDKFETAKKNLLNAIDRIAKNYWTSVHVLFPRILNQQKTDFNDLLKENGLKKGQKEFDYIVKTGKTFEMEDFSNNNFQQNQSCNIEQNLSRARQKLEVLINSVDKAYNEFQR
ncbi:MAG: MobF family relaxase [Legionellales bacterium]|jgi:conjugative relaxase-like TrwC/TraI family protein